MNGGSGTFNARYVSKSTHKQYSNLVDTIKLIVVVSHSQLVSIVATIVATTKITPRC